MTDTTITVTTKTATKLHGFMVVVRQQLRLLTTNVTTRVSNSAAIIKQFYSQPHTFKRPTTYPSRMFLLVIGIPFDVESSTLTRGGTVEMFSLSWILREFIGTFGILATHLGIL